MKKILIVDDQPSIAMVLEDILEDADYNIITAANGELGISKAKSEKPDLIIMDVMMPVKDGITAIRELRAIPDFQTIPIFILSAKGGTHDENLVNELKISGFLQKPFSPGIILEQIEKALS
jgi:DNA-binding response OmpR family regulator